MRNKLIREISEREKDYIEELELYDKVVKVTGLISLNQHDIQTDGRGIRAVKIFTRQTLIGLSLGKLLPRTDFSEPDDGELWDVSSIASLSGNMLEGYLSLYYFGIENISESEAELRFFILQLHRNIEWYNIRKYHSPNDPDIEEFEEVIPEQKNKIRNHPFLSNLTIEQKKKAIQGSEMYKTKADFENELAICKDLRRDYRQLSNLVHPLPLSIERIDNDRGRGLGSEPDVIYCLICMMIARRYLAASTIGIADKFPIELANRFSKEIESIRPLENVGFN